MDISAAAVGRLADLEEPIRPFESALLDITGVLAVGQRAHNVARWRGAS